MHWQTHKDLSLLLAFEGFEKDLLEELSHQQVVVEDRVDRLIVARGVKTRPAWAQAYGRNLRVQTIKSVSDASKTLKAHGRRWACASQSLHRRSELIQEQTFRFKDPVIGFRAKLPADTWGIWALWDQHTLLFSAETSEVLPLGEVVFKEDEAPPSRAYLKLWETFTLHREVPAAGSRVLDLGSSPGGWTWALSQMDLQVTSVDKAPLEPKVAADPRVKFLKKDAFKIKPADVGQIDWLFSDLICYPARLLELVQMWHDAGVKNFVCSVKFQGETDFKTLDQLAAWPGARLIHLCANKHEVTWLLG